MSDAVDPDVLSAAMRLIAGSTLPKGGPAFVRAGIEVRLDTGGVTYWRYPGDAGLPPTAEPIVYNSYLRDGMAPFPPAPVNAAPVADVFFRDFGLINGHQYGYAVRTVARIGGNLVESALSTPAEVTPQTGK